MILESGGARRIPGERQQYETMLGDLRLRLGDEQFQHAYERGYQMPLDTLLPLALAAQPAASTRRRPDGRA